MIVEEKRKRALAQNLLDPIQSQFQSHHDRTLQGILQVVFKMLPVLVE